MDFWYQLNAINLMRVFLNVKTTVNWILIAVILVEINHLRELLLTTVMILRLPLYLIVLLMNLTQKDVKLVVIIITYLKIEANVQLSHQIVLQWKLILVLVKNVTQVMDWLFNILIVLKLSLGFVQLLLLIEVKCVLLKIILITQQTQKLLLQVLQNFISMECFVKTVLINLYLHWVDINVIIIQNQDIFMITI